MKLFLDTADIDEIRTVAKWGVLHGVTTNPSLFARTSARPTTRSSPKSARLPRPGFG